MKVLPLTHFQTHPDIDYDLGEFFSTLNSSIIKKPLIIILNSKLQKARGLCQYVRFGPESTQS